MNEKTKKLIDEMDYESMLQAWRFHPLGDTLFQGETGQYFAEVMRKKRTEVGDAEHVRASKSIGWERP